MTIAFRDSGWSSSAVWSYYIDATSTQMFILLTKKKYCLNWLSAENEGMDARWSWGAEVQGPVVNGF